MTNLDKMPRVIDANYTVWTPDTQITLTNVPWDNNYRDVVRFAGADQAAQQRALNSYIDRQDTANVRITDSSYARVDRPIRLEVPFTDAYGFNYVRVFNPSQPAARNPGMYFYYFITGIDYVNPGTTMFTVQLDVWQTFGAKVKLGQCYVERGHVAIANTNATNNHGRDYLTLPEGLDTGAEHRIIQDRIIGVLDPNNSTVRVVSTIDLSQDPGTITDPGIKTSPGTMVQGAPSGAAVYFFEAQMFQQFVKAYAPYPWILQGIISITAVPTPGIFGYKLNRIDGFKGATFWQVMDPSEKGRGQDTSMYPKWRSDNNIVNAIPERYRGLKKFHTYPYMSIEMTAFNGAPIVLKPEQWNNDDAQITMKVSYVAPGERAVIYPRNYNARNDAPERTQTIAGRKEHFDDGGDYLEMAVAITNFPTYAIVNNAGILSIASQAHSLAQQYKTNDWSQQKNLAGNALAYDQANVGNANTQANAMVGRNAAIGQNDLINSQAVTRGVINAGMGLIGSTAGGARAGGPGGAAAGLAAGGFSAVGSALQTGLDISQRNQALAISNGANVDTTRNNAQTTQYMTDTNRKLSDWAAKGDYENTIATIQAKVQDTALTPPFTAGQAGGDTFNFIFGGVNVMLRWKMLPPAELAAIGEYWLRYGYAVRRFITPPADFHAMTKFTYWKMLETYMVGSSIPEGIKQAIRGILEKGVTVWVNPDDIGTIDMATNKPKTGIAY